MKSNEDILLFNVCNIDKHISLKKNNVFSTTFGSIMISEQIIRAEFESSLTFYHHKSVTEQMISDEVGSPESGYLSKT